jgi:hypothetical protein
MSASKTLLDEWQKKMDQFLGALCQDEDWQFPPGDPSDEKLWSLLPAINAPYVYDNLSREEAVALTEALSDGFNTNFPYFFSRTLVPKSIVKSRLLDHALYVVDEEQDLEYDTDRWNTQFLERYFYEFPLALNQQCLQIYFQNQFNRLCHAVDLFELDGPVALEWLYEKPWYELHALSCLKQIRSLKKRVISEMVGTSEIAKKSSAIPYELHAEDLTSELIFLSGQLGRLVEQYCWRFQHETAIVAGQGARKGASVGGKAKAERDQIKHSMWQKEASKIWANRPDLSKIAVANIIIKKFGLVCTAKHISRYIAHP